MIILIKGLMGDSIVANLLSKSSLTPAQIDTLLLSKQEGKLAQKASLRDTKKVSKGSFARTLRQGQTNVESSIYTLFLLAYLDLIPPGRLPQLARTGELITRVRDREPDRATIKQLLVAMDDFARGFSGRTG